MKTQDEGYEYDDDNGDDDRGDDNEDDDDRNTIMR